jgi:hypothetical protein
MLELSKNATTNPITYHRDILTLNAVMPSTSEKEPTVIL